MGKRQRQNERDRLINKSRKTRMKTAMKNAFLALEAVELDESITAEDHEDFADAEKKIGEAFSAIDQAYAQRSASQHCSQEEGPAHHQEEEGAAGEGMAQGGVGVDR